MPQQLVPTLENSFVKGLVTSSTGLNFPKNAVTDSENVIYDFLGVAHRREGFDFEVNSQPKTATFSGGAISSFLWHNVLGDGSLNIYVVQIGNKLYFYPLSPTGAPLSAQLVSAPLDFSTVSALSSAFTLIAPVTNPPVIAHIGDLTGNGGLAAGFNGVTIEPLSASAKQSTSNTSTVTGYIGQNYTGTPQIVGTATIYPPSDGNQMGTITKTYSDTATQYSCVDFGCVFVSNSVSNQTVNTSASTITVNLRGNAVAPASSADGTLLATGAFTGQALTLTSNDQVTTWNYVWFEIIITDIDTSVPPSSDSGVGYSAGNPYIRTLHSYSLVSYTVNMGVAEAQFYSPFISSTSPQLPQYECQYANGLGYLFVTHPYCIPFVVTYTAGSPATYTATAVTLKVRDFDGVNDGLLDTFIDTRPSSTIPLANQHLYNLYNQGWNATVITAWQTSYANTYPSNADVWWQLKSAAGAFDPTQRGNIDFGTSAAPKGHFIYDAFYIDRGANIASGAGSLGVTSSNFNRPSTVAFFAGRVFYAGVNYPNYANSIWFSQTISPTSSNIISDLGHCYEQNDPTSETLFDLLPTDGGVIKIADCGQIVKLFPMQNRLIVFATNGIWEVAGTKGTAGLGFTANDYTINRISNTRQLSGTSFVDVLGIPFWWNNEGIYTIKIDQNTGGLHQENITYGSINAFYEAIPRTSKIYARGCYNPIDYTVQWLYRTTLPTTTPDDYYKYDGILVLNTATGSFSPWTVSTGDVNIASIVVTDTGAETDVVPPSITFTYKYFVTYLDPVTLAQTLNIADDFDTDYLDWESFNGVGQQYTSTFTSGYKLDGGGSRKFQNNYIRVYSENEIPNAYKLQGIWDYATDPNSGKYTGVQLVNNTLTRFKNMARKHKIRGRGLVLQFKITSYQNEPFNIIGWSALEGINRLP